MRRKKPIRRVVLCSAVFLALLVCGAAVLATGCGIGAVVNIMDNNEPHFFGVVTQVRENSILVKVNDGEKARASSDLLSVSLKTVRADSDRSFAVGDEVIVYYDGAIAESYPGQVLVVYAIFIIKPG